MGGLPGFATLIVLALWGQSSSALALRADGPDADRILRRSRQTIGSEAALSRIQTLIVTGTEVSSALGVNASTTVQLTASFPDRFRISRSQVTAGMTFADIRGLNRGQFWRAVASGPEARDVRALPQGARERRPLGMEEEITRYLIAWLLIAPPALEARVGRLTARPEDPTCTLQVMGAGEFAVTLCIDPETQRLARLRYRAPEPRMVSASGGRVSDPNGPTPALATYESRLEDYKRIGGLQVPHRIVTTMNGERIRQFTLSEMTINPPVADALFMPPK